MRFPQPVTRPLNPVVINLPVKKKEVYTLDIFGLSQSGQGVLKSCSYILATFLLGRQMGWITVLNGIGRLRCSRAMSRFRFSFQLYFGWTMIWSITIIFSMPCSNLKICEGSNEAH